MIGDWNNSHRAVNGYSMLGKCRERLDIFPRFILIKLGINLDMSYAPLYILNQIRWSQWFLLVTQSMKKCNCGDSETVKKYTTE